MEEGPKLLSGRVTPWPTLCLSRASPVTLLSPLQVKNPLTSHPLPRGWLSFWRPLAGPDVDAGRPAGIKSVTQTRTHGRYDRYS
jgi:hypothetical protein